MDHSRTDRAARTVSSVDAYVLPHLVELSARQEGTVTHVLVREREVVATGQELVEIASGSERYVLRSPGPALVSRCRVEVGDRAARGAPLVSLVRADDVLVLARFDPIAAPALRNGRRVRVRIPRATARPVDATVTCVMGVRRPRGAVEVDEAAAVRALVRLDLAPPAALCPGMEAIVDVDREP